MINISMDGVKDAVEIFRELIIPWQRKNAERKANLENALRKSEIQRLNAQTLAEQAKIKREQAAAELDRAQAELILSQAQKAEAEAKLILAQAEKTIAEAEKERETLRLERIKLAMEIVEKYNPELGGPEKINFVIRLLPDLDRLMASGIELIE